MKYFEKLPAVLVLEDGTAFHGTSAGKIGSATGEICFNTGMTGYQEIFTDPSYHGQILTTTNAHIGNYGTMAAEDESDRVQINALVCRNFTNLYSRKMADRSIQEYFLAHNLIAIADVDTRQLVRHIRDKGAMNAMVSSETTDIAELLTQLREVPRMEGLELASVVSTKSTYEFGDASSVYRVAVLDLGVKRSILRCLAEAGCFLKVFPAKTPAAELLEWEPDGVFFSNGPGDPASMDYAVDTAKAVLAQGVPFFGICLGHQILGRALGLPTYKMHHGHRGANHPVLNMKTKRGEITTQNHGFGVSKDAVLQQSDLLEITHMNLNDDTVEGISVIGKPAFSVQYHPEAGPGPHDSRYLFREFVERIQQHQTTKVAST